MLDFKIFITTLTDKSTTLPEFKRRASFLTEATGENRRMNIFNGLKFRLECLLCIKEVLEFHFMDLFLSLLTISHDLQRAASSGIGERCWLRYHDADSPPYESSHSNPFGHIRTPMPTISSFPRTSMIRTCMACRVNQCHHPQH
jgi:hypothetical protein